MPTIADHIRAHLSATGKSKRALSLEAGFSDSWVKDILSGRSKRPGADALARLSAILGVNLDAILNERVTTAADALELLDKQPPLGWSSSVIAGTRTAVRFYVRASGAGGPDVTILDRAGIRAWLNSTTAATHGISEATFNTYASLLRSLLDVLGASDRPRQIRDVSGPWRMLYDAVKAELKQYAHFAMGPFCAWCAFSGVRIDEVRPETFLEYLNHRLDSGKLTASASKHRRVAMEVHNTWTGLSALPAFVTLGVRPVPSPFSDGRDKYGMPAGMLDPLLREFDTAVLPWVRGETTPRGVPVDEVLDALAPVNVGPVDEKKARLRAFLGTNTRARRQGREERLRAAGVLLRGAIWNARTQATARAGVVSLAKALWQKTEVVVESINELTDPEVLESAAQALEEANDEQGIGSSYVESVLKRLKKLAEGYVGRGAEEIASIRAVIAGFKPDFAGIAPRNRLKLQELTPARIAAFLRMSDDIVAEVNADLARRRRSAARLRSASPGKGVLDAELAGRLEVALAHDIMLARAPRPGNLLDIDLAEHVRRRADGGVTIELPKHLVKNRVDLAIPLGGKASEFFDSYVEKVRPLLLTERNAANTRLFPARYADEGHYSVLTKRLTDEVHRRIGIRIHPHLYRHILGWIWLREDPNALPAVQKLLGHKRLETTMQFYVELDETLALQQWADILEEKRHAADPAPAAGGSDRRRRNPDRRLAA